MPNAHPTTEDEEPIPRVPWAGPLRGLPETVREGHIRMTVTTVDVWIDAPGTAIAGTIESGFDFIVGARAPRDRLAGAYIANGYPGESFTNAFYKIALNDVSPSAPIYLGQGMCTIVTPVRVCITLAKACWRGDRGPSDNCLL